METSAAVVRTEQLDSGREQEYDPSLIRPELKLALDGIKDTSDLSVVGLNLGRSLYDRWKMKPEDLALKQELKDTYYNSLTGFINTLTAMKRDSKTNEEIQAKVEEIKPELTKAATDYNSLRNALDLSEKAWQLADDVNAKLGTWTRMCCGNQLSAQIHANANYIIDTLKEATRNRDSEGAFQQLKSLAKDLDDTDLEKVADRLLNPFVMRNLAKGLMAVADGNKSAMKKHMATAVAQAADLDLTKRPSLNAEVKKIDKVLTKK